MNVNCPFKRPLNPLFTKGICMFFSLCCEVVSRLQFGALGGLGVGAGVKHGVVGV